MIGTKDEIIRWLKDAPEKVYEIKEHKVKRSLTANSYYWALESKLADVLKTSKEEMHEILLARYGQYLLDESGNIVVLAMKREVNAGKIGGLHLTFDHSRGETIYYRVLKGSHDYDTREMSILIDGLISECEEQGIETLTPEELAQLHGYAPAGSRDFQSNEGST